MKEIKAKDIQRIIASTNAQNASIEIKQLIDNYREKKVKNLTIPRVSNSVCEYYENGFYAEYGTDMCVNCGQRKAKHSQTDC